MKPRKPIEPEKRFGDLLADLKIDNLPPPPEPPRPVNHVPTKEEIQMAQLSPQDRELLEKFGGASARVAWKATPCKKK